MEARLTALETKISFTEDLLDEVNRVVFRQQEQIDLLQQQIRSLYQQFQNRGAVDGQTPEDDVPPHY